MHRSVFNTSLGMNRWHDQEEQTPDSSNRTWWFYPPKTPDRIRIHELQEEIKRLKLQIKQEDDEIESQTQEKEYYDTRIRKYEDKLNAIKEEKEFRRKQQQDWEREHPPLTEQQRELIAARQEGWTGIMQADVYNIMPRTENDTVNQYFIHTSFGNSWSTPKKSDNEVITELEQEIQQLKQKIANQQITIRRLTLEIGYRKGRLEVLFERWRSPYSNL